MNDQSEGAAMREQKTGQGGERLNRRDFLRNSLTQSAALTMIGSAAFAKSSFVSSFYPDPRIVSLDKRFHAKLGNAAVECLADGFRWAEGPVYFRDLRCLIFSDIPNNRLMRWDEDDGHLSVFRSPSNNTNGNTRDKQGRLISCEHGARRVTRTEHDGRMTVLADKFEGKKFNAPNDLVVDSQGAVWFTDPGYGIESGYEGNKEESEQPRRVYRIDPKDGSIKIVADDNLRPNGLCFSPDEKHLYIVDSANSEGQPACVRVYDVGKNSLSNGKVLMKDFGTGTADGIKTDTDGNIWCGVGWGDASENGVRCYTSTGELIGKIQLPEICGNLCFGGPKNNRLFMTGSTSLYSVYLNAFGA